MCFFNICEKCRKSIFVKRKEIRAVNYIFEKLRDFG